MANVVKTTPYDNKGKLRKMKDIKTGEGNPCVFPFQHKRKMVNNCIDGKTGKWCATETDNKGKVLKWGYCVEEKKKKQKEKKKDSDPLIGKYKFLVYYFNIIYLIIPTKKITDDSYEIDAIVPASAGPAMLFKGQILVAGEEAGPEGFIDLTSIKITDPVQPTKYCVIDKDNNPVKSVGKNHDICGVFFDLILNNPKAFDYKKSEKKKSKKKKSEKKKSKSQKSDKQPANILIKVYFDVSNIEKTLELNIIENSKRVIVKKFGKNIFDGGVKNIKQAFNLYQKERDRLARKYDIFNFEGLTDDEIQAKIPTFMYSKVDINTCDYDTSFVDSDTKLKDLINADKKVLQIWNKNCFDIDELAQYLIATNGKNLDPIKQTMLQNDPLWRNEDELISLMNHPFVDPAHAVQFRKTMNDKLTEMRMPSYVEIVNRSQDFMDRMAILAKMCTEDYSSNFAPATEEIGRFVEYFHHTFSEEEIKKLNLIETKSGLTLQSAIENVHKHCIHGVGFRFYSLYCVAFSKTRSFLQSMNKPVKLKLIPGVVEISPDVFMFAHGSMRDNATIRMINGIPDRPTFIIWDEENYIGQSPGGTGRILKGNKDNIYTDAVWGFTSDYAKNKKKLVNAFYYQMVNNKPENILNIWSNRKDKYLNDWVEEEQKKKEVDMSPKSRKKSVKSRKENSIKKRTIKKTGRATKKYKKELMDKIMNVYSDFELLDMAAKYILDEYNPDGRGHLLRNSKGRHITFKIIIHQRGIKIQIKEQKTKYTFQNIELYIHGNSSPRDSFAKYIFEKILDGYEDLGYGNIFLTQNPIPLSSSSSNSSDLEQQIEEKVKVESPKKSPAPAKAPKLPSDKTIAKMKREGKLPFEGDLNKAMAAQDRNAIRLLMQARKINLDDFPASPVASPKPPAAKMPSDKTIAKMKRDGKLPFNGDFNKAAAAQDRGAIRILMKARNINVDDFQQVEEAVQQGKVQLRKKSKTKNMIIKTGEQVKLTKKKKRVEQAKKEGLTTPKKKTPPKSPPALNRKKTLKKKSKSSNSSSNKVQWGIRINKQGQKIHEAENAKCIFPFTYKNKEYNTCINNNSKGGPWCATKVDPKTKKMIKYGYCPENERQKNYLSKIINTEKNNSGKQQPPKMNAQELINKIPKYLDNNWITLKPDSTNTKIVIANPKDNLYKSKELYLKKDGKLIETFSISFDITDAKKYIKSPLKYNSIRIELTTRALGKMPFTKSYIWKFSNIYSKVNPNKLIADKIKLGYDHLL
jgi:hypothetical protein